MVTGVTLRTPHFIFGRTLVLRSQGPERRPGTDRRGLFRGVEDPDKTRLDPDSREIDQVPKTTPRIRDPLFWDDKDETHRSSCP